MSSRKRNGRSRPASRPVAPNGVGTAPDAALCACDDPLAEVRDAARELGDADAINGVPPSPTSAPTPNSAGGESAPRASEAASDATETQDDPPGVRIARMIARQLMILCALAVLYTLYFAQAVFIPIAMSLVLYLLLRPVVQWMCRRRIPSFVSALLCLVAIGLAVVLCVMPLVTVGQQWLTDLPREMDRAKGKLAVVLKPIERISFTWTKVEKLAAGTDEKLPEPVYVQQPELTGNTVLLSTTGNMLGSLLVVVVLVFFLLTSGDQLLNRLLEQFPRFREKRKIVELILSVQNGISFYLFTITQINLCMGLIIGLMAWAYGLPNPALWGLMAAVFNFVPFVGPAVGGAVVGFVALITFDSIWYACLPPLTYYVIAILEGNLVSPALIGRQMSLSPIMVLLFLIFWGWMWGIAGAALAVPILAMLKLGMDRFEPTQPAAALLGD